MVLLFEFCFFFLLDLVSSLSVAVCDCDVCRRSGGGEICVFCFGEIRLISSDFCLLGRISLRDLLDMYGFVRKCYLIFK